MIDYILSSVKKISNKEGKYFLVLFMCLCVFSLYSFISLLMRSLKVLFAWAVASSKSCILECVKRVNFSLLSFVEFYDLIGFDIIAHIRGVIINFRLECTFIPVPIFSVLPIRILISPLLSLD